MTSAAEDYTGTDNLEVMKDAARYNAFLLDLIRKHAPAKGRTLDFGAGCGTFAVPLGREGMDLTCLEPDATLGSLLQATGLSVVTALDHIEPGSFDFIYTLNVLEHIENDDGVLVALRAKLKSDGRLLIYVPAFQLLFTSMDRKVGHFRRYRRTSLIAKVKRAGFSVEVARYADSLGFFATLVFKIFGNETGNLDRGQIRFYDKFVLPISLILDHIFWPLFGKNLLIVTRPIGRP